MLEEIIVDKNKAWGRELEKNTDKFLVDVSDEVINEIRSKRMEIHSENESDFPILTNQIKIFKRDILINGCGFFVINGSKFSEFSYDEMNSILKIISKIIGELLEQNKDHEKVVEIKDLGKTMKAGSRYHHTKEGGSYHTDGCHIYHNFPHYVGLVCINPAKSGGESKFASSYTLHNQLLEEKNLLKILYEKFHIDKRNENEINESPTQYEPIFQYENNNLVFRYQRELIEAGYKKMNQSLTSIQKDALNALDRALANENFAVAYLMNPYDMMFSNNKWLIHDRNGFEDFDEENKKRVLLRTWIREFE